MCIKYRENVYNSVSKYTSLYSGWEKSKSKTMRGHFAKFIKGVLTTKAVTTKASIAWATVASEATITSVASVRTTIASVAATVAVMFAFEFGSGSL